MQISDTSAHSTFTWLAAVSVTGDGSYTFGLCVQSEKELQSGGEVKELLDVADSLSKRLVKDTTAWTNKKETLQADQAACQQARPALPHYTCYTMNCTKPCTYAAAIKPQAAHAFASNICHKP